MTTHVISVRDTESVEIQNYKDATSAVFRPALNSRESPEMISKFQLTFFYWNFVVICAIFLQ